MRDLVGGGDREHRRRECERYVPPAPVSAGDERHRPADGDDDSGRGGQARNKYRIPYNFDTDDGTAEVYVVYGDGRVVALSYDG